MAVLFRSPAEPFHPDLLQACHVIGPLLGDHLARVIRIHHRHVGGPKG